MPSHDRRRPAGESSRVPPEYRPKALPLWQPARSSTVNSLLMSLVAYSPLFVYFGLSLFHILSLQLLHRLSSSQFSSFTSFYLFPLHFSLNSPLFFSF
jgi:hypothetical protein